MTGYDLLEEPWIPVVDDHGDPGEWGIRRVLHEAGRVRLAFSMGEHGVPVLRLLLALSYRILPGPGEGGRPEDMWLDLYERDGFDEDAVDAYLDRWAPRFDLLDPSRPFMQTPGLETGRGPVPLRDADPATRDAGPFRGPSMPEGGYDPGEAALKLLSIQAWDTAGIKTAAKGSPTAHTGKEYAPHGFPGMGLCGIMDMAWLEGPDLYHTLILGWSPACRREGDQAVWERGNPPGPAPVAGRRPIGPADCLTWPSRRVLLQGGADGVTAAAVAYGDTIDPAAMHGIEPMACWVRDRHDPGLIRPRGMNRPQSLASWLNGILPASPADRDLCPSGLSWAASHLPVAAGVDIGLKLRTSSMIYGTQGSTITGFETYDSGIVPDCLTHTGAAVLRRTASGLLDIDNAWTDYRLAMMSAAGGNPNGSPARSKALRDQASIEIRQPLETALGRILAGDDPTGALSDLVSTVRGQPAPDSPPAFMARNGVIPALARRRLEARLSAALLGRGLANLTDLADAIAGEQEGLDQAAREAMGRGWPASALTRAYGRSEATIKRLRKGRAGTGGRKGPDPRPGMIDARIRREALSTLFSDLCAWANGSGVSLMRIEQATGVNRMTLQRRVDKRVEHDAEGHPLWQIWMPGDTWADQYTVRAVTLGVATVMESTATVQDRDRMERLLDAWARRPRMLKDRASGLRILPHVEYDIRPDPAKVQDGQDRPASGTRAAGRRRRLTKEDDARILQAYESKKATVKELAGRYGVSAPTIYNSLRRGRR